MDKANWGPEEISNLTKELNYYGTHYRNAVACLYNTFTYELADYWRGNNYNKVAQFVNEHYDDFDKITYNLCIGIPTIFQGIAQMQSEDGLGSIEIFSYEIDLPGDGAVGFNLIPMTETFADGRITLTEDLAKKYIDGNSEPSLPFYSERMEEYMDGYINTLEKFSGIKEFNEALKIASESVETYKIYSLQVSKDVIDETRLRANVELGIISDTDANSKDLAVRVLNGNEGDSTSPLTSVSNNTASGIDYSSVKSPSTPKAAYTASKGNSTSGINSSASTSSTTSATNSSTSTSSTTSGTNSSASTTSTKSNGTAATIVSTLKQEKKHIITKEEVESAKFDYDTATELWEQAKIDYQNIKTDSSKDIVDSLYAEKEAHKKNFEELYIEYKKQKRNNEKKV